MIRSLLAHHNACRLDDLKAAACLVCSQVSKDQVAKAISDFPLRLEALVESRGAHFERTFKKFKRDRRGRTKCNPCDNIHPCDCEECDNNCLTNILAGFDLQDRCDTISIDPFAMDID